jgi:Zn2+/Cd2+-exporting ATPase
VKDYKADEGFSGRWYAHPPMRNALIAGMLTGISFALAYLGIIPAWAEVLTYIVAIALGGYHWSKEAFEELIEEKTVSIEMLMLAATVGSAILGMWDEAAFLVVLYAAAEGLEEYTYARTRHSIRALLNLAPRESRVVRNGREEKVYAEQLGIGEVFIVRPGESIATDGIILRGHSSLNEAPVTGESMPVEKIEGMKVFAGTINQEGALEIKVTASFKDNTLSRMIHMVEEAQEQKGKTQAFIEGFGRRYSPLVLLSSIAMVVVPFILKMPLEEWATRAVVLLVAAAPCALVMSTPVAIAAGIGVAGKRGVLIKGGMHLESLGRVKVVAFDKTGTLTEGRPVVTDIVAVDGVRSKVLQMAYSVERLSEHPLAKAIAQKAEEENVLPFEVDGFTAVTGLGATGTFAGGAVLVGKQEMFNTDSDNSLLTRSADELRLQGKTVVFVGTETGIVGLIAIRDKIRSQSATVIDQLHTMGITVAMLTGDSNIVAGAIAQELRVDEVKADLKPEDKVAAIAELEHRHGCVAMVGDGINDSPALARASIGIAMGVAGTDAAVEAADVALMADDLLKIPYALRLGSRSRRISRQNIAFSLFILGVLIPSALAGIMSVAIAVVVHETAELLAVANGLRVAKGEQ